jgi:excisionase family DNA binding protein
MPSKTHELLLIEEVAETCRAPVGTVRHWLRTHRLPSLRLGRRAWYAAKTSRGFSAAR